MRTILTSKELWKNQAPNLNFVTKVGDDQYLVNEKYTEEVNRRM